MYSCTLSTSTRFSGSNIQISMMAQLTQMLQILQKKVSILKSNFHINSKIKSILNSRSMHSPKLGTYDILARKKLLI